MSQTTYANTFSGAFSGQLGDTGYSRKGTYINGEGADIPAGIFVAFKSESGQYKQADLPDAVSDRIVGVVLNSFARNPNDLADEDAVLDGDSMNVLEEGAVFMAVEQSMGTADSVYCRITSDGGSNTQLGKVRKDSDSGRAILVPGARVLFAGTTSQPALIYFSAAAFAAHLPQAAIVALTDSTGGSGSHDDTLADGLTVTAPAAVTAVDLDNEIVASADAQQDVVALTVGDGTMAGTADGNFEDVGDTSAGDQSGAIENNFKEVQAKLALAQANDATIAVQVDALTVDVTALQAKVATIVTDLTTQNQNDSDLAQKILEIRTALISAGILQA